jgi:hypothetical protein
MTTHKNNGVVPMSVGNDALLDYTSIHIVPAPAECVNLSPNNSSFLSRALPLAALGLEVSPIDPRGKEPLALGFLNKRGKMARLSRTTHATNNPELIKAKWGGPQYTSCNVGGFFRGANYGVDIDNLSECERVLGGSLDISGARVRTSTPDKLHLYFDGPVPEWFWAFGAKYTDAAGDHELFSVRYLNQHLVGPGSIHPSGVVYEWVDGVPDKLPPTNERLLRQLRAIAEKSGAKKPANEPDGANLPESRYDAIVEKLRAEFRRLEFPAYEETEHRGGVAFIFDECPMGAHTDGDPTGMVFVKPDGRICWNCFHNSHAGQWSVIRKELEALYGVFDFGDVFKGPAVVFKAPRVEGGERRTPCPRTSSSSRSRAHKQTTWATL